MIDSNSKWTYEKVLLGVGCRPVCCSLHATVSQPPQKNLTLGVNIRIELKNIPSAPKKKHSRTPLIRNLIIRIPNYPDQLGPSAKHIVTVIVPHLYMA
jgi:hypothetical protein